MNKFYFENNNQLSFYNFDLRIQINVHHKKKTISTYDLKRKQTKWHFINFPVGGTGLGQ